MSNVLEKSCRETQSTLLFKKFFSENRIEMKYGTARQATDDRIIRCMRFACRVNKIRKHTQNV